MISRIKQKTKQIFSWYNRNSIENNKGKEASAMGRHSKTVIEYRSYEFPPHFPLRVIAGEEWRISDVPSGVLHFHNCLEILLMCLSRVFYRFFDFLLEKGRIKLNPQQLWIFEKTI